MSLAQWRGEKKFYGVALFLILAGVVALSVGVVQWIWQLLADIRFGWPAAKMVGGLLVIGLGYVVLELELIRQGVKK